jgi:hypothetical protein
MEFQITTKYDVSKTSSVSFFRWGPVIEVTLSKGFNTLGTSFPAPEDWNRSTFRNTVFYIYLEFQTVGKVHKFIDSESYTL